MHGFVIAGWVLGPPRLSALPLSPVPQQSFKTHKLRVFALMSLEHQEMDPTMDLNNLYLEEVFTDRKVGTLRRLTPVTAEGAPDSSRPVLYVGQAQIVTAVGALPLSFEIEAGSLEEAVRKFADEAKVAVDRTMDEIQELRREAASSIVIPEMGPGGTGGAGGGGKIQIP